MDFLEKLQTYKDYITYDKGYRIVYFYENYHEVVKNLHADNIDEFLKLSNIDVSLIDCLLEKMLKKNNILGVAIYDISGNCIISKFKKNYSSLNQNISIEELIYDYGDIKDNDGYRIVYDDDKIGLFCKTIEGFMVDFVPYEPYDDEDIPRFISINNLLDNYLNKYLNIKSVSLYKTNGTLIAKKNVK